MADFQDYHILNFEQDFEYNLRGDTLLGPRDREEEPMNQGGYDSNVCILDEEEVPQPQRILKIFLHALQGLRLLFN